MLQKPWLATIWTTSETLPAMEDVLAKMREIPGYETLDFEWITREPEKWVFRTRYATLAVTLVDESPVPMEELKQACRRAWHWPEASFGLTQGTHRMVVAVMPDEKELDAVDVALLLTCLASAVAQCTAATAILWNASGMLHAPEEFTRHTEGMNRQTLPVELWVEFRIVQNSDQSLSVGTWGLEGFALDEFEVSHSRRDLRWLLRWIFNLSHFVLENGPVFESEQTFGSKDSEKFTVTRGISAAELDRRGNGKVIQLHFESESPVE
ncbi:MAG: DUF4261 domain-containing protein [Planctomycetia bacterium]|nr:DUF4261 domain-containing protein [Planctomycetia bacterium]